MKLFDELERHDTEPAQNSESEFAYLNRSARAEANQTRQMLEVWFSHYPDSEKSELRSRFRSDIDSQHRAASFELFLHELLLKLGYRVTPHPTVPGNVTKTPDFLAEASPDDHFYLEATLATGESAQKAAAQARMKSVYDTLNRIVDSPNFFLWLDIKGSPTTQPPAKKVASFIKANLDKLDPDEVTKLFESEGIDALPRWQFEHEGWKIEFHPIPKKPEARGKPGVRPIGMQSYGVQRVDHRTPIRDAIIDKAGRYGELDLPYIVAINAVEPIDQIDIMEALFGKEQFTITFSETEPAKPIQSEMSRAPDGVWMGPSGPRYTRVSGVLLAARFTLWNVTSAYLRLYHNPWAQRPYLSVLARLAQGILEGNHIKMVDGESPGTILGLDEVSPE